MERQFKYDIMPEIKERWSMRAFSEEKISEDDIMAIIEAAKYAPSCFNEQPWRFIVADDDEKLEKMRGVLVESNQVWANAAPVLIAILSQKVFSYNGKDNFWNMFDTGTAWGYLSLEAHRRGLATHAMGGFSRSKLREVFGVSDNHEIICVVALGKPGNKESLSEALQKREKPDIRKETSDFLL